MDMSLPTLTPQVGDSQQMLLARIARSVSAYSLPSAKVGLASATRTGYTTTGIISADGWKGVHWWLNITAASGTGGLGIQLVTVDPLNLSTIGGYQFHNLLNGVALATGFIYPGAVSAATNNFVASQALVVPPRFRLAVSHADASNYTYSLNYALIE